MQNSGIKTLLHRHKAWHVLSTRVIYQAKPWVELSIQRVRLPDGRVVEDYHQIRLPEYCMVFAETTEGMVIAARQYRHGVGGECITLPAGLIEESEQALEAMKRELLEETGYTADDWKSLGSYVPNSNYGCGKAHLFSASDARYVKEPCSGDLEESEVLLLTRDEIFQTISEGRIASLSMVAAVSLATNPHFTRGAHAPACSRWRLADGLGVNGSDSVMKVVGASSGRGAQSGTRARVRSPKQACKISVLAFA